MSSPTSVRVSPGFGREKSDRRTPAPTRRTHDEQGEKRRSACAGTSAVGWASVRECHMRDAPDHTVSL
jgi:hypothetical protein